MANWGPRIYCNTFKIISETSKNLTLYGPFHPFFMTKILQKNKEGMESSWKNIDSYLNILEIHVFVNLGKDGHRTIPKSRLMKSWKCWIWNQYLSKNMNGFLIIWYQYLLQSIKILFGNIQTSKNSDTTAHHTILKKCVYYFGTPPPKKKQSSSPSVFNRNVQKSFWNISKSLFLLQNPKT